MEIISISDKNREQINDFLISHWYSTDMVVRGEVVDMTKLDGFAAYENENIIGLITYRIEDSECEIMSLDSLKENRGIGTTLLNKAIETASNINCTKIKLITTNDNINAMRFYQKRGFDIMRIYRNALEKSRKIKPSIPMTGDFGIPLKHEIEFERKIEHHADINH